MNAKELGYGLSVQRAIELGEDPEYPRMGAAVFHYDKLTSEEQQRVIDGKEAELVEALEERKTLFREAKKSADTNRRLSIDPRGLNPFPHLKQRNRDRITFLEKQIASLKQRKHN